LTGFVIFFLIHILVLEAALEEMFLGEVSALGVVPEAEIIVLKVVFGLGPILRVHDFEVFVIFILAIIRVVFHRIVQIVQSIRVNVQKVGLIFEGGVPVLDGNVLEGVGVRHQECSEVLMVVLVFSVLVII